MSTQEPFPPEIEQGLMGKRVLASLRWIDADDNEIGARQLHGRVVAVEAGRGITLKLEGSGETFVLPPDPGAFQTAPQGVYTLRNTGERVENPDLIATWLIHPTGADSERPQ